MVLAGRKDLASTCMLHLQIVFVLQFLGTFQSVVKDGFGRMGSEGENRYDLS